MNAHTRNRSLRARVGAASGFGLIVVTAAAGAACSSGAMPVGSKYVKTATVGASGGTVAVAASDDLAIVGTSITIPPHALAADTTISIGIASGTLPRTGATGIGPLIDFAPSGTTFAVPVTITLPATLPSGVAASTVFVEEIDANQATRTLTAVYANGLASIQTTDLAEFGAYAAEPAVGCTTDTDCAPGGVCMAGTCTGTRVPPDAGVDSSAPGACSQDTDCAAGETCIAGQCTVATADGDSGAGDAADAADAADAGDATVQGDAAACTGAITNTYCNGMCVDLTSDSANCGACGMACPSGTTCTMDRCF